MKWHVISSHFKKLLADASITLTTSQALKGEAIDLDTKNSPSSCLPVSVEASTGSPVDPGGSVEILTEPVHQRSAVVSVFPKETHPGDLINDNSLS